MNTFAEHSPATDRGCAVCDEPGLIVARREVEDYRLMGCPRCGVWSVHPRPPREMLEEIYDEDYYAPWQLQEHQRKRLWKRRLRLLRSARRGRLLDVGCAEGDFLTVARDAGFEVSGTEFSHHGACRTSARLGVPVHHGELAQADLPRGAFSVVTFWHVLEHMVRPGEALSVARELLEPGGQLVVAIPNRDSPVFHAAYRLGRGRPLHLYHPDDREQHLHHWDSSALHLALDIHGFDVIALMPDPCALGAAKRFVDLAGRVHSWLVGRPRTNAMVALARRRGEPT